MPTNARSAARPTYPGVHVEELPSSTRTISAVTTSVTAFVGHTRRGPLNEPVRVTGFTEFERRFGGLGSQSAVAHAVHQFFGNGGGVAVIVRVAKAGSGKAACTALESTDGHSETRVLEVHAKEPGVWGNGLRIAVDYDTPHPDDTFNLRVHDAKGDTRESFTGLSMDAGHGRHAPTVINAASRLIRVEAVGEGRPDPSGTVSKPFGRELPHLGVDLTVKIGDIEREFTLHDPDCDGPAPTTVAELALLLERKLRALP
ncbi:phage tail protein, partial [Streptomyces pharetrae]